MLHRYCVVLAFCTFLVVIAGGLLPPDALTLPPFHVGLLILVGLLTLGLVVWLMVAEKRPWVRNFGWVALAIGVAQGALGTKGVLQAVPHLATLTHACLGALFFAAVVLIAVFTSEGWERGPEFVRDQGWPSLRSLAIATPVLVLSQVLLGAAFRHEALGLMPHILGAMVATLTVLMVCMFALQQFPQHPALRPAAIALAVVTSLQVTLGIAVITLQAMTSKDADSLRFTVAAHVATGALTLATSMVLGVQIRRNVQPATEAVQS